jgi:capsular exopolysaccharide synthesis family protein
MQIDAKLAGSAEPSQDDIREAEQDPVVLRALGDIQTLRGLVAEHRQKFGADHQQVRESQRALDARIREKDRKVEEVVFRNLQGQRKLASDSIERLFAVEGALEAEIEEKSAKLTDFVAALADLEKKRADLERLEERRVRIQEQIDSIDAMFARKDAEQIKPVNAITTPLEPSSPMWYIAIPGTAFLLLGFVGGVVFLREVLDKRVRSTTDLTALPGMRLLGVIPDLKDDPTDVGRAESVIRDSPGSVVAESHRQFAAAFRRARQDADARSILFVGGMPDSGTTSVVSNLAVIAASVGRKVALVDGNLRRPRIAEVFGLDPQEPGLGDVMCGAASLDSVIQTTQEGLRIVTAGTPANRTFERLDSDHLKVVVDELLKHVDVVLVDGPPAVVAGEAMGMADQVDATLLVVRAYSEQRGLVARLARQLREQPSTFLGVVLNRPRNTAGGYFKRNYEAIASYASDKD